ncbi:MAG TPA: Ig-like domain-containing protein [Cellulomonas sp.]
MNARITRRIAAGATALAVAGLGLGIGATAASAVDTVSGGPAFGGSFYLMNGNTADDITPGTSVMAWNGNEAPEAIPAPGDTSGRVGGDATAIGATGLDYFLAPQGQEATKTAWNAYVAVPITGVGELNANLTPMGLLNPGQGSPAGQGAVAAAGGDYSLGLAYTKNSDVTVVKVWYVHIHVTANANPQLATFTYQPVQAAVVKTNTTTTITASPSGTVNTGDPFTLTAHVSDSTATGTVNFQVGGTTIGTATVTGGVATTTTASVSTAGANQVVAVYSGDTAFNGSTSPAVTVNAVLKPITTTTTASATSADNTALHPAVLSAVVTPAGATGTVAFTGSVNGGTSQNLGSAPVDPTGHVSITTTGLTQGTWTINAAFTGTSPYVSSASTAAATLILTAAAYPSATPDPQNVDVVIPAGSLVITTPWTSAAPLHLGTAVLDSATSTWSTPVTNFASATDQSKAIQVVDTRAGVPGFTAQVSSTDFANGPQTFPVSYMGLVNVASHQVASNAILAGDVHTSNVASLSSSAQTFATYHPASPTLGTAWISGDLNLTGVPTSVQPGTYTATLTLTAF